MKSLIQALIILLPTLLAGCGFLDNPDVTNFTKDKTVPITEKVTDAIWDIPIPGEDDSETFLYLWPISAPLMVAKAGLWTIPWIAQGAILVPPLAVDEACQLARAAPPAAEATVDYWKLPFSENNVLIHHSLSLPKIVATPLVFSGLYLWHFAVPDDWQ